MWEDKEIESALSLPAQGMLLLITVGNSMRGDDGAGPYIAQGLKDLTKRVKVYDAALNPENSLELCEHLHPRKVVFIDAANWEGDTGEIRLIPEDLIPVQTVSTHMFPLSSIGALIKQDEDCEVNYLGIQLATAHLGADMSPEVKMSCDKLIHYLQKTYSLLQ